MPPTKKQDGNEVEIWKSRCTEMRKKADAEYARAERAEAERDNASRIGLDFERRWKESQAALSLANKNLAEKEAENGRLAEALDRWAKCSYGCRSNAPGNSWEDCDCGLRNFLENLEDRKSTPAQPEPLDDEYDVCECDHIRGAHPVTDCDGCQGCDKFKLARRYKGPHHDRSAPGGRE